MMMESNAATATPNWDPASMLEPDLLLPEQMDQNATPRKGEIGLLWAVLMDGIETYCREVLRGSTTSLAYREVERWIFRPDSDALTSFSNLCTLFNYDPRRMRRGLLRFRENPNVDVAQILERVAA